MSKQVAIDTSVLVGLINPYDLWQTQAVGLHQALEAAGLRLTYFDCVTTEAISAISGNVGDGGHSGLPVSLRTGSPRDHPHCTTTEIS